MYIYERINIFNLFPLLISTRQVKYFSITKCAEFLIRLLMKKNVKKIEWFLGMLHGENEELLTFKILSEDLINIVNDIKRDEINNEFINEFDPSNKDKVHLFITKEIQAQLEKKIIYINVVEYIAKRENVERAILYFRDNEYSKYLSIYSLEKGIIIRFPIFVLKSLVTKYLINILGYAILFPLREFCKKLINKREYTKESNKPLIATFFNLNKITCKRDRRSALSLFLNSKNLFHKLLIYFKRQDVPCNEKMVAQLDDLGIKYIALNKNSDSSGKVPIWTVTHLFFQVIFRENMRLIRRIFKRILFFKTDGFKYMPYLFKYNGIYAESYDFYKTLNIKVNVNMIAYLGSNIPRGIALKDSGGIYVSYQISNFPLPNLLVGNSADVYFSFGPYYKEILLKSGSNIEKVLYSGYISDYSFSVLKSKAIEQRDELLNSGVKFVIAFFDEGIRDEKSNTQSMKTIKNIIEFFAQIVIENKDIAVLHKPKRTKFQFDSEILNRAISTNRYLLITEGIYESSSYPAEISLAADVAIGYLAGGTTVFESILAGVPSIYLDLEKIYSFIEYQHGRNNFVFDRLKNLKKMIDRLKNGTAELKYPKEFLTMLKAKDPFQDGQAITRIGDYLSWLMEKIDAGEGRESALNYATQRYGDKWGWKHVNSII